MKKSGFTLIELLAVIIILAVVLAIAIPVIVNFLSGAKISSFRSDARFIVDQARIEKIKDDTFDSTTIDLDTLPNYNMSTDNYESLVVTIVDDKPYINIVGQNKWEGLKACGTYNDMTVVSIDDTETCQEPSVIIPLSDESCFDFADGVINGYDSDTCGTDVNIPSTIGGVNVTSIDASAFSFLLLTNINIPNTVTSIGEGAFVANMLPDSQAFIYNRKPDGSIDNTSLNSYGGARQDNVVIPSTVIEIGAYAFEPYDGGITSVTIQDGVTTIGEGAFMWNGLESVEIPNSVTSIGGWAFAENQITDLTLSENLESIGTYAFSENLIMMSLTIPDSVTTIEDRAFFINQIVDLTLSKNLESIGESAFYVNQIESIIIPDNVTSIGDSAFRDNLIGDITIGNSVLTIGESSFYNNLIVTLVLPASVTSLGTNAFSVNNIANLTLSDNITSMGYNAFMNNKLTDIIIPSSYTSISGRAFANNLLTDITIPDSVTTIGEQAFLSNKLESLIIPSTVTSIGTGAFASNNLPTGQEFIFNRDSEGNIINTSLNSYGGINKDNIEIPEGVAIIGKDAFLNSDINSVTIPSSTTTIMAGAFMTNNLTSIIIPASVTTMEVWSFNENSFTSVTIQGTPVTRFNTAWTSIGFPLNLRP